MEIRCVKGMYRLKLVSSENNSVVKGLLANRLKQPKIFLQSVLLLYCELNQAQLFATLAVIMEYTHNWNWAGSCIGWWIVRASTQAMCLCSRSTPSLQPSLRPHPQYRRYNRQCIWLWERQLKSAGASSLAVADLLMLLCHGSGGRNIQQSKIPGSIPTWISVNLVSSSFSKA